MRPEEIGGIIYSLKEHNFDLLHKRTKPVYVKYLPQGGGKYPTKLTPGHFILFYLSGGSKSIIGYAEISDVAIKYPPEIERNYSNRMQMDCDEFDEYTLDRKDKTMIVLILENLVVLKKLIPIQFPITMAGKYISKDELKQILKQFISS